MTPLEAARLLQTQSPIYNDRGFYECPGCSGYSERREAFEHESDCPWLAMPRIVAVLEAADKIRASMSLVGRGCTTSLFDDLMALKETMEVVPSSTRLTGTTFES